MKNANKLANPDHAVLPIIAEHYSPYVFEPKGVERGKLLRMLEAACWTASSFNEQPWRYILAKRSDAKGFVAALECLVDAKQVWAKHTGCSCCVVPRSISPTMSPNRWQEPDS